MAELDDVFRIYSKILQCCMLMVNDFGIRYSQGDLFFLK